MRKIVYFYVKDYVLGFMVISQILLLRRNQVFLLVNEVTKSSLKGYTNKINTSPLE